MLSLRHPGKKPFKATFTVTFHAVTSVANRNQPLFIAWSRGTKSGETRKALVQDHQATWADGESISIQSTMFRQAGTDRIDPKNLHLTLKEVIENNNKTSSKPCGKLVLNLADYIAKPPMGPQTYTVTEKRSSGMKIVLAVRVTSVGSGAPIGPRMAASSGSTSNAGSGNGDPRSTSRRMSVHSELSTPLGNAMGSVPPLPPTGAPAVRHGSSGSISIPSRLSARRASLNSNLALDPGSESSASRITDWSDEEEDLSDNDLPFGSPSIRRTSSFTIASPATGSVSPSVYGPSSASLARMPSTSAGLEAVMYSPSAIARSRSASLQAAPLNRRTESNASGSTTNSSSSLGSLAGIVPALQTTASGNIRVSPTGSEDTTPRARTPGRPVLQKASTGPATNSELIHRLLNEDQDWSFVKPEDRALEEGQSGETTSASTTGTSTKPPSTWSVPTTPQGSLRLRTPARGSVGRAAGLESFRPSSVRGHRRHVSLSAAFNKGATSLNLGSLGSPSATFSPSGRRRGRLDMSMFQSPQEAAEDEEDAKDEDVSDSPNPRKRPKSMAEADMGASVWSMFQQPKASPRQTEPSSNRASSSSLGGKSAAQARNSSSSNSSLPSTNSASEKNLAANAGSPRTSHSTTDEALVLEKLVSDVAPHISFQGDWTGGEGGVPVSAALIFGALRHWGMFAESQQLPGTVAFLSRLSTAIGVQVEGATDNLEKISFWLANLAYLMGLIQRKISVPGIAFEPAAPLTSLTHHASSFSNKDTTLSSSQSGPLASSAHAAVMTVHGGASNSPVPLPRSISSISLASEANGDARGRSASTISLASSKSSSSIARTRARALIRQASSESSLELNKTSRSNSPLVVEQSTTPEDGSGSGEGSHSPKTTDQEGSGPTPVQSFAMDLAEVGQVAFHAVLDLLYEEITRILVSELLEQREGTAPASGLLNLLSGAGSLLKDSGVPDQLNWQVLERVFAFVNMHGFNTILQRPELCSLGHGLQMKMAIREIVTWANEWGGTVLERSASTQLSHLAQVANVLITAKAQAFDAEARREVCPNLNLLQLRHILGMYVPDSFDPDPLPSGVLTALDSELATTTGGSLLLEQDNRVASFADIRTDPDCAVKVTVPAALRGNPAFKFLARGPASRSGSVVSLQEAFKADPVRGE